MVAAGIAVLVVLCSLLIADVATGGDMSEAAATRTASFDPSKPLVVSEYQDTVNLGLAALAALSAVVVSALALYLLMRTLRSKYSFWVYAICLPIVLPGASAPLTFFGTGASADEKNQAEVVQAVEWAEERYGVEVNPGELKDVLASGETGYLTVDGTQRVALVNSSDSWLMVDEYPAASG